jgi:uncharacterized protein YwqG
MSIFDFFFKKNKQTQENMSMDEQEVEVTPGLLLPKVFAQHWDAIKKTRIDYIKIEATPSEKISRKESHFGYYPFITKGFDYPKDENDEPMIPLAQLNFSEIPHLQDYPEKGLLQFYIASSDCYGLDFDDPYNPKSFRVVYIENPDDVEEDTETEFLNKLINSENTPVFKPHKLTFSKQEEYVGISDVRSEGAEFNLEQCIKDFSEDVKDDLQDKAYEVFNNMCHKIGGYANFTQTDPREYDKKSKNSILLFQMDSDDEIMWGDVGIANFFIEREDLIKKDFSKVMYNWDCC